MLKLLIAMDGSENAMRAAAHVCHLVRRGVAIEAVLCNVQPPVRSGEVGVIAPIEVAERKRTTRAATAFAPAVRLLAEARITPTTLEVMGDPAEEIVRAAKSLHCDGIVVGRRGLGAMASLVAGSVSSAVVRASHLPVTVVK